MIKTLKITIELNDFELPEHEYEEFMDAYDSDDLGRFFGYIRWNHERAGRTSIQVEPVESDTAVQHD